MRGSEKGVFLKVLGGAFVLFCSQLEKIFIHVYFPALFRISDIYVYMINPGIAGLLGRYRHSSADNFFSVRDKSNNVYIERKLRFWRLRICARKSGIWSGKVESDEIPIQVKNVIFRFLQRNIVIFALRSN